jgi:hypothetical protein
MLTRDVIVLLDSVARTAMIHCAPCMNYSPYSPNLSSCGFNMFGLKEALNGCRFESDEHMTMVVHSFFATAGVSVGCLPEQPWALC